MDKQPAFSPEGHLRIAQQLIAGSEVRRRYPVPEGRLKDVASPNSLDCYFNPCEEQYTSDRAIAWQRPVLVGCCPSSGSTLLSVMLDAHPDLMCGPELSIFAHPLVWRQTAPPGASDCSRAWRLSNAPSAGAVEPGPRRRAVREGDYRRRTFALVRLDPRRPERADPRLRFGRRPGSQFV